MKQTLRLLLCLGLVFGLTASNAKAQSAAQSKDYWVTFFPSIDNIAPIWLLAATNVPGTKVKVTYMEDNTIDEFTISPNQPKEYRIKLMTGGATSYLMAKPDVPEVVQKRSVHVEASHPISLQGFTDADNNVGLFLVMPTSSLGQKYTISAFNDQHSRIGEGGGFGGWEPAAFPPTGGGFILLAPEDNTEVTMTVTGPTAGGKLPGQTWSVTLDKGETYWVRGAAQSEDDDLSRSKVRSSKPIAVFAGCEIARTYDALVLQNHFDYNDYQVEQMIPEEIWGKEYVSGPMTNKRGTKEDDLWGEYYRVYASEPTDLIMDGSSRGISDYWEFHLQTEPRIFKADKPFMVVQNDYYIDFHGINPKNPRTANNEMVLVPRHNWRKNATFTVPKGYEQTFFAVVAHKDSIDKITASMNGAVPRPIGGMRFNGAVTYTQDEYRIYTISLGERGQCIVQGPCDFAVYNYGTRDNDQIKATYSYASAAAASFGSISNAKPPRMVMDSTCTEFNLKFYNTSADARGFGDIYLLYDAKGQVYDSKIKISTNVHLDVTKFNLGADSIFAKVTVQDPLKDAKAYLYVTNRAGKDTVYTFTYNGTKVAVTPTIQQMPNVLVFGQECKVYNFKNTGKSDLEITGLSFKQQRGGIPTPFTVNLAGVPKVLKPNESMDITACFNPKDTGILHWDSLQIQTACFVADIARIEGMGKVPTIFADDQEYGLVDIGNTKCENIEISNLSTEKELVLTKDILKANNEFSISPSELARFPITLAKKGQPGDKTLINICYTPIDEGSDSAFIVWGRDIPSPYNVDNRKEWSVLRGKAQRAGVGITSADAQAICDGNSTLTVDLRNTGSGKAHIDSVWIEGTDAAEFTLMSIQGVNPNDWLLGFDIDTMDTRLVTTRFTPAAPQEWRIHTARIITLQNNGEMDTAYLSVDMRRPEVASPGMVNLPAIGEGEVATSSFDIVNTGNLDFRVKSFGFKNGTVFSVVSGIAVGDIIPANTGKITINVSGTSNTANTYTDDFEVFGEDCGEIVKPHAMIVQRFEVTASGTDIPATWTCKEDNNYSVTFSNRSSGDVMLKGLEMIAAGSQNASQISFGTPTVGTVMNGGIITFNGGETVVAAGQTMEFPINFASSIVGPANVTVQFTYVDRDGIPQVLERNVTAIGKNYPVDLAITGTAHRGENDVELEIPIEVSQSNLFDAEVYGYEFDVTFNEDNFTIRDVVTGNGHIDPTFTEVGKTSQNGVDYVTYRIRAHDGSRVENNENILARLVIATRLTTENNTTIVPSNFNFLDQAGRATCWTPKTEAGNEFTYDPLCGDPSLAEYLKNGISFLQNNKMAPNPASTSSIYEFDLQANNIPVSISVFDALGNQVSSVMAEKTLNAGRHSVSIDVTTLPAGTYYVRTNAGEGWVATQKLTVQK